MCSKKTKIPTLPNSRRKHNPLLNYPDNTPNKLAEHMSDIAIDKAADLDIEMLIVLLKHYNIGIRDDDRWLQLSYELAYEYIPAFKYEAQKRGRKIKWTPETEQQLIEHVTKQKKVKPKHSILNACEELIKNKLYAGIKATTLHNRYKKIKASSK